MHRIVTSDGRIFATSDGRVYVTSDGVIESTRVVRIKSKPKVLRRRSNPHLVIRH